MFTQRLSGIANFTLTGQKDQNISRPFAVQLVAGIDDGIVEIALFFLLGFFRLHRTVTHLDREQAAGNLDHRRFVKVHREALGINGRRGDDQLEIRTLWQNLLEVAEQEIDVQAALMRFIENQRVVLAKPRVTLRFGEQDAVGHQLDVRLRRSTVSKANLVAHHAAQFAIQLLRDAGSSGACSNAARLRVANEAGGAAPELQANFRNLRRLARPGFAANNHHLMLVNQLGNLGAPHIDRQVIGKLGLRQALAAQRNGRTRTLQQLVVLGLQGIALAPEQMTQITRHRAQAALIDNEAVLEL